MKKMMGEAGPDEGLVSQRIIAWVQNVARPSILTELSTLDEPSLTRPSQPT